MLLLRTRTEQGIPQQLADCFGSAVFRADLPELADNLFAPQGVIQEAQQLAADAFGGRTYVVLVNGSTCGVEQSWLLVPLVTKILPRNVHSSCSRINPLRCHPVFVNPEYDPETSPTVSLWMAAAPRRQGSNDGLPDVLHGICGDVAAIASVQHPSASRSSRCPLCLSSRLTHQPLAGGADLTVHLSTRYWER